MRLVDVRSGGLAQAVGAWIVDEAVLVDPGPEATVDVLLDAVGDWRPRAIALTHVHLDHAGATGALIERWPGCEVWVHERGAPHLIAPGRLLSSARRVYGTRLDSLWGAMRPVPAEAIRVVGDGTRIGRFDVLEAPGHARHHVLYLHRATNTFFVGDVAGVRIAPGSVVLAPTVAPDFDPVAWQQSIRRIAEREPSQLALAHFGAYRDVQWHLEAARDSVLLWAQAAQRLDEASFTAAIRAALSRAGGPQTVAAYEHASQPDILWAGAHRYVARAAEGQ